jgi:hypothetical protein
MPDMLSKIKGQDLIFSVVLPRLLLPKQVAGSIPVAGSSYQAVMI